ncbi:MAG TPA: tRNA glutamyl-Q(34) synthetase GluQRS [Ktedonobacteraceae bacterium]|nr:tRNA glutamyl-Q(34) synthetase GluQRS [Ktedonobacteraceae bacterium]
MRENWLPLVGTMSALADNPVRGRYAPSPTGDLHMGNLRTALLAWLYARCAGGQFVLRIEDLDLPRVRAQSSARMLSDLRWLGLDWNEGPDCGGPYAPYVQSQRNDIYQHYLQRLQDAGLLYPCYCSRSEIAHVASAPQQGADEGPRNLDTFRVPTPLSRLAALRNAESRYPGTCRHLTQTQRQRHEANGRRPSLRFRVDDQRIVSFTDLVAGPITQHVQQAVGDFIVRRSDGIFAYQFAVVVDDALMHINQVVRGADLLSSTARQILLYEALGFPIPTFAHVPLMLDGHGKRLAKRDLSAGLEPLRAAGATAEQIVGQLAASCHLVIPGTAISPTGLIQESFCQSYDIMRAKLQLQNR